MLSRVLDAIDNSLDLTPTQPVPATPNAQASGSNPRRTELARAVQRQNSPLTGVGAAGAYTVSITSFFAF